MNINDKKRLLAAALCFIFCLFGYFTGNSIPSGDVSLIAGETAAVTSFPQFMGELYPVCRTLMIQFAIIFVFAFTPYKYIANCSVFFLRGCAIGYTAEFILSQDSYDFTAVCFTISYLLITAVMMISVLHLSRLKENASKESGFSSKLQCAASTLILFLMSTGASTLLKIIPIVATMAGNLK